MSDKAIIIEPGHVEAVREWAASKGTLQVVPTPLHNDLGDRPPSPPVKRVRKPLVLLFPVDEEPRLVREDATCAMIADDGRPIPGKPARIYEWGTTRYGEALLSSAILAAFCEKHGGTGERRICHGARPFTDGPLGVGDRVELWDPRVDGKTFCTAQPWQEQNRHLMLAPATITGLHAGTCDSQLNMPGRYVEQYPDEPYDSDRWVVAMELQA